MSQDENEVKYEWNFEVAEEFGEIGAVLIENEYHKEMYLKNIAFDGFPNGPVVLHAIHGLLQRLIILRREFSSPTRVLLGIILLKDNAYPFIPPSLHKPIVPIKTELTTTSYYRANHNVVRHVKPSYLGSKYSDHGDREHTWTELTLARSFPYLDRTNTWTVVYLLSSFHHGP
ncbi:hypothetical protein ACSBR1_022070 [Camellia fascicularis]